MAVLADFIIATEAEAKDYATDKRGGFMSENLLQLEGITVRELTTLLASLRGEEWREEMVSLFPPVAGVNGLRLVSDTLLNQLTAFDFEFEQVARDWTAKEQMRWTPAQAQALLEEIGAHGVKAQIKAKPIYLWNES